MIGKFRHVFESLRRERGEWTVFAVLQRRRRAVCHWEMAAAAPWLPEARRDDLGMILDKLAEVSTPQERGDVGRLMLFHQPTEVVAAAKELLGGRKIAHPVGLVRRRNFDFRGRTYHRGYAWAVNVTVALAAAATADATASAATAAARPRRTTSRFRRSVRGEARQRDGVVPEGRPDPS